MLGLTTLIDTGLKLVNKFIPDPELKAKTEREQRASELEVLKQVGLSDEHQASVNKTEAESQSLFKSGWRPAAGWTCVLGMIYSFILKPMLTYVLLLTGLFLNVDISHIPPMPSLNVEELIAMLGGLLGLGVYRSMDKRSVR